MKHCNELTLSIMTHIDKDQAWSDLPILADALEESGYNDTDMLTNLRSGNTRWFGPWYRRVVEGKVTTQQVEEAIQWMKECAARFAAARYDFEEDAPDNPEENFDWLMKVCARAVQEGDGRTILSYVTPDYDAEELWKQYEVLTGTTPPTEEWRGETYPVFPFRCVC